MKLKHKLTNYIFQCLRLLFAGLSSRMPGFDPRSFHVTHVTYKLALNQFFLPVISFSPVSTIPLFLHTHLHTNTFLIRRKNERSLGTLKQRTALPIFGSFVQKRALLSFIGSENSVQACASVFETIVRILRSNCINWKGGSITFE